MKDFATLLIRATMIVVCCFATWMSVRHARANLAAAGWPKLPAMERAVRIEPDDVELLAADAVFKSDNDDSSPAVNEQLLRAVRLDPYNSQLLMALGLRAELRGDTVLAENYLAKAAESDRSFTPGWTYASFCVRNGQPDKFWAQAKRLLSLDPLLLDPRPLFDLAWRITNDPQKIRGMLPQTGPRLVDYLGYLMDTKRIDAAAKIWPDVLGALDPSRPSSVPTALAYCDFMAANNRMSNAVTAWNQLVDKRLVRSGHLDPATGASIADPDFAFPPAKGIFGWQVAGNDGVFVTSGSSAIRFELDGNQPEALGLLSTTAPLLPRKTYRLEWKFDSSQLDSPHDRGFGILIVQQPGNVSTSCGPFLGTGETGTCTFTTGSEAQRAGIELRYARASGTTRARGTLVISAIRLVFGHE